MYALLQMFILPLEPPKRAYKYSDLFCVQWKEMLKVFPKAKYIGVL